MENEPETETDMWTKPAPKHRIRYGSIHASIWANESDKGVWYNVTLERRYRDKEGRWQQAPGFRHVDLLPAARALETAYDWITSELQEN